MAIPIGSAIGAHYTWNVGFLHFFTPENQGANLTYAVLSRWLRVGLSGRQSSLCNERLNQRWGEGETQQAENYTFEIFSA